MHSQVSVWSGEISQVKQLKKLSSRKQLETTASDHSPLTDMLKMSLHEQISELQFVQLKLRYFSKKEDCHRSL